MECLTQLEFLDLFDASIHDQIRMTVKNHPDSVAIVCFENLQMDSSEFGNCSAVIVGPSNTLKSVDYCEGTWIRDLPSQRQYPQSYSLLNEWEV